MQHAAERDVVDVVAGARRERPFLAPARHASVDQLFVLFECLLRVDAEPLHHAGTEAFDERVGARNERERGFGAAR